MNFTLMLAKVMNIFLGSNTSNEIDMGIFGKVELKEGVPAFVTSILAPIFNVLGWLIPIAMILLGVAGVVYAIVLGVNFAKAETADQKQAAKSRLINVVIGVVVMIVALVLILVFIKNVPSIFDWVKTGEGK